MIKDKFIPKLAYLFIILALLLCISIYLYNKFTPEILESPEYIENSFNKDKIMEIKIEIDEDNLTSLIDNAMVEEYVPANITIDGISISNIGIRAKGNSSLQQVSSSNQPERYSFKINFSEYITDQNFLGLEKMVLNNMIGDSTYLKEYLSYDLMEFMDINTPGFCFASISINGEYWGLYLAAETLEEDFLERYYGKDYGNLYKPDESEMGGRNNVDRNNVQPPNINRENMDTNQEQPPIMNDQNMDTNQEQPPIMNDQNADIQAQAPSKNMDKIGGNNKSKVSGLIYIDDEISSYSTIFESVVTEGLTEEDKYRYIEMVKALNEGGDISKYLDVDEVLRYFAVNTFLVNLDSYAGNMKHNYYLYDDNGVFSILPWDFNLSFGTFQMNSGQDVVNFPIDEPVTDTMENSPLIAKLLEVDEYKELYHSYLNQIVEEYVNSGIYENKINTLNELIYDYVAIDDVAFYTLEEYEIGIENLLIYGEDRAKSISLQLSGEQPSNNYGDLETNLDINSLGSIGNGMGGNRNGKIEQQNMEQNKPDINAEITEENQNDTTVPSTNNNQNSKVDNIEQNINISSKKERNDRFAPTKQQNISSYKNIIIYGIILLIGIIYAFVYKRKKYNMKKFNTK